MFEALVLVCLLGDPQTCAPRLLPGYEAATLAGCQARLSSAPPDLSGLVGVVASSGPDCAPFGAALDFDEVAPGVFVHTGQIAVPGRDNLGDVANIGVVVGDTGVAVIDTGTTRRIGEGVWRAIRARTDLPVTHVILTHLHPDHVLGTAPLAEAGAVVVGHAALNRALGERAENYLANLNDSLGAETMLGTEVVLAEDQIAETGRIDLGGRVLQLRAWPRAHTGTDLTVFDPTSGVFFAGDLVFAGHLPSLDGSLPGWLAVLEDMAGLPVSAVVPGHGGPVLGWPEGAHPMQRYLSVLARDTRKAIADGMRIGDAVDSVAASEAPFWDLFDTFNPQNASVAYTELEWE